MWNNDQQQGTWWPNYNYQYQAASEDGDRSQEWAVKAAMWAQQRQLQEQMLQQQNQQQPPPPADTEHPPLPIETAPPQPPPPDVEGNVPFIHSERLKKLHDDSNDAESSNSWHDHQEEHISRSDNHQKNWKPFGNLDYSERDDKDKFPTHHDDHHADSPHFHSNHLQYPEDQNFWDPSHHQQWSHGNHHPFPPPHGMNFQQPAPFVPIQGVPAPMMPNFYPHGAAPDSRPNMTIPEQIIASQIPEVNVQETNKRKGLPQWLRDALNKKEKEKQKKFEKENAKKASSDETDEEEAISTDRLNRKQSPVRKGLLDTRGTSKGLDSVVKHSGYSSDDESDDEKSEEERQKQPVERELSVEERAYEQMQKIKLWMMETLVAVTNDEIVSVVNEVYSHARKKARVSGELLRNSGGLAALRSGLALNYDSSSGNESDDESDDSGKQSKWYEHEKKERDRRRNERVVSSHEEKAHDQHGRHGKEHSIYDRKELDKPDIKDGIDEKERRPTEPSDEEGSHDRRKKPRKSDTRIGSREIEKESPKIIEKDHRKKKEDSVRKSKNDEKLISGKSHVSKDESSSTESSSTEDSDDKKKRKKKRKRARGSDSDRGKARKKKSKRDSIGDRRRSRRKKEDGSDSSLNVKKEKRRRNDGRSSSESENSRAQKKIRKRRSDDLLEVKDRKREGDRRGRKGDDREFTHREEKERTRERGSGDKQRGKYSSGRSSKRKNKYSSSEDSDDTSDSEREYKERRKKREGKRNHKHRSRSVSRSPKHHKR